MTEALWLMIINELSNIGIDTKRLQKLSHDIWIKPFNEKYADVVFKKIIAEMKAKGYFNGLDTKIVTFGLLGMLNWVAKW